MVYGRLFFITQKASYGVRSSYWSSDVVTTGHLPRRAARTLGRGGRTGLFRDKPGQGGCAVIARTTSETAIDDDANAVYGKAGFRNAGGENNLAHASFSGANGSALVRRVERTVQLVNR